MNNACYMYKTIYSDGEFTFSHILPAEPVCLVISRWPSIWPASLLISAALTEYNIVKSVSRVWIMVAMEHENNNNNV